MPEATPAMSVLAVVGRGLHPKLDSVIARSTAQPMKMDSPSGERMAIDHAPTREPGMRAREEMPTTRQDVSRKVRASVKLEMHSASSRMSVGTSSGRMSAIMGVAMVPKPKPMVP